MVTQELLDYIKTALASGQSREAIIQALVQNGWEAGDAQEGLTTVTGEPIPLRPSQETTVHTPPPQTREINSAGSVSNSYVQPQPENQMRSQVASTRSILPTAIIAGTAVIIVGIGITLWILTKKDASPSKLATEQTAPVEATTIKNIDKQIQVNTIELATTTPIATSSKPTNSKSLTQGSSVVDCGGDLSCLIQKAKKCEPATVKLESNGGFFGVKVTTREILSLAVTSSTTSGKCQFSIKQGKTDVVFPAGTSPENITQGTKQQTAFDGMTGSCNTSTATLVDVLNKRMLVGGFSIVAGDCDLIAGVCKRKIGGLETAQCSGNYFQYKFDPKTGEVIKE